VLSAILGVAALLLAILGTLAFMLVWLPIQEFLELRQRIKDRLTEFTADRRHENQVHLLVRNDIEIHLTAAQRDFSYLADQLRLFRPRPKPVLFALHIMRFDLDKAEEGLVALVHAIGMERTQRLRERSTRIVGQSKNAAR
jgi:hypothetical protein